MSRSRVRQRRWPTKVAHLDPYDLAERRAYERLKKRRHRANRRARGLDSPGPKYVPSQPWRPLSEAELAALAPKPEPTIQEHYQRLLWQAAL